MKQDEGSAPGDPQASFWEADACEKRAETLHFPKPQRILALTGRLPRYALHLLRTTLSGPAHARSPISPKQRKDTHPLTWLDGLRGIACLSVFVFHNVEYGSTDELRLALLNPYGYNGEHLALTLPFLRLLQQGGRLGLYLFFVISGYVLTYKPLQHIHARRDAALMATVSSSLMRRWARLFLPVILLNLTWVTSWHVFGITSSMGPAPQPTWWAELRGCLYAMLWKNQWNTYSGHLWAIPVEFQGSVMVLATVVATCSLSNMARLTTVAGLCLYRFISNPYDAAFLAGMLVCDITLLAEADQLPQWWQRRTPKGAWKSLWYVPLLLGLHLFTFSHGEVTSWDDYRTVPGWTIANLLHPSALSLGMAAHWFTFWPAVLVIITIPQITWLKKLCQSDVLLWLGKHSFAIYLIHGPLVWTIGVRLYTACGLKRYDLSWWADRVNIPSYGPSGLSLPFLIPMAMILVLTLSLAPLSSHVINLVGGRAVNAVYERMLRHDSGATQDGRTRNIAEGSQARETMPSATERDQDVRS